MPTLHAIIPAGGHSTRMGTHKLLLRVCGETLVAKLIDALTHTDIDSIDVLIRANDSSLRKELLSCRVNIIEAVDEPPDMLASIRMLVRHLKDHRCVESNSGWLLIPADHPIIDAAVLDRLIAAWKSSPEKIVVPTFHGKRGHPTIFPWNIALQLASIPEDQGLNWLVRQSNQVWEVDCGDESILMDVDTPEDYKKLLSRLE